MLLAAFPAALSKDVEADSATLAGAGRAETSGSLVPLRLGGEAIVIPYRVYFAPPSRLDEAEVPSTRALIRACVFTRHHQGHVRQANVGQLLRATAPWVVPYVVQLLGEYVVEIAEAISLHARVLETPPYKTFASDNAEYIARTTDRAISYWNIGYRDRFPDMETYPALRMLRALTPRLRAI